MNSELHDHAANLQAVNEGSDVESNVPHGDLLSQLVEATLDRERQSELAGIRDGIVNTLGPAALVDAAAIIGNFQRMVRIADGTGIPLDKPVAVMSADLRKDLKFDRFGSAELTPKVNPVMRSLSKLLQPLMLKRFVQTKKQPSQSPSGHS